MKEISIRRIRKIPRYKISIVFTIRTKNRYFDLDYILQIVEWLNEASLNPGEDIKVANLCKVQEILINKEPQLLPLYLDEALQFSLDRNAEVRKTITGFIEEAG